MIQQRWGGLCSVLGPISYFSFRLCAYLLAGVSVALNVSVSNWYINYPVTLEASFSKASVTSALFQLKIPGGPIERSLATIPTNFPRFLLFS